MNWPDQFGRDTAFIMLTTGRVSFTRHLLPAEAHSLLPACGWPPHHDTAQNPTTAGHTKTLQRGMEGAGGFRFNFSIDEVLAVKCGPRLH